MAELTIAQPPIFQWNEGATRHKQEGWTLVQLQQGVGTFSISDADKEVTEVTPLTSSFTADQKVVTVPAKLVKADQVPKSFTMYWEVKIPDWFPEVTTPMPARLNMSVTWDEHLCDRDPAFELDISQLLTSAVITGATFSRTRFSAYWVAAGVFLFKRFNPPTIKLRVSYPKCSIVPTGAGEQNFNCYLALGMEVEETNVALRVPASAEETTELVFSSYEELSEES